MPTSRQNRPLCITERKLYVEIADIDKPVLLQSDYFAILEKTGGQVHARCREHLGLIKLLLKASSECPNDVFQRAEDEALADASRDLASTSPRRASSCSRLLPPGGGSPAS